MRSTITLYPILSESNEKNSTVLAPVMLDTTGGRYAKSVEIKQELVSVHTTIETLKSRIAALEGKLLRISPKISNLSLNIADITSSFLATDSNGNLNSLGLSEGSLVLANGANQNIPLGNSLVKVSGPTGGFSLGGFLAPSVAQILLVYNSTAQQMTINNQDAGSSAGNRILTLTGGNVVLRAGTSFATFVYSTSSARWILISTN